MLPGEKRVSHHAGGGMFFPDQNRHPTCKEEEKMCTGENFRKEKKHSLAILAGDHYELETFVQHQLDWFREIALNFFQEDQVETERQQEQQVALALQGKEDKNFEVVELEVFQENKKTENRCLQEPPVLEPMVLITVGDLSREKCALDSANKARATGETSGKILSLDFQSRVLAIREILEEVSQVALQNKVSDIQETLREGKK